MLVGSVYVKPRFDYAGGRRAEGGKTMRKRGQEATTFGVVAALAVALIGGSASGQVKGGSGDKAEFSRWRAEMRKALYVPEKLPALEAKTWSSFAPMPGV